MTTLPAPTFLDSIRLIAADIKLAHSVFALPFALLAAVMAFPPHEIGTGAFLGKLGMVVLAMVFARTAAMLANRLIDREIDARNARTAQRAIPSGRLPPSRAIIALAVSAAAFLLVCIAFGALFANWWPAILAIPVLAWISVYAWLKRFTALCHIYLGSSLAISPIAAALAIHPPAIVEQPALWFVGGMVLCWVAGFDIIYALQDVEVDRREKLFSMPSRAGVPAALWISRILHVLAVACLIAALVFDPRLDLLFAAGVLLIAALLGYEHFTVSRWGTTRIALAFFTLNGIISCALGILGIIDTLL